jgi:rhodanese-related sulfurtransferase
LNKSASDLVAEAKQAIENLNPDQVAKELEDGALLVDVREPDERKQSSIPGSISAPRGMLEFYADPDLPYHKPEFTPERRIVLHCASGGRSALAAATLKQMGYENVAHLDGGIKAWQEAGRTVEPA